MAKDAPKRSVDSAAKPDVPSFRGFVLRLFAYLFAVSLTFSLGGLHFRLEPLQTSIARSTILGANLLGANARFQPAVQYPDGRLQGPIIDVSNLRLEINHECTAIFVALVYAAFVLAYPASWKQRASGIAVGVLSLHLVNVARLVVLTLIAKDRPDLFGYFHEYFFQGLFIALLAGLASIWTERVRLASLTHVRS